MVLAGFVTAWRLASWPTRRSPVLVKATTDGTVRPPSAEAMTVGSPPSMTATTLFVVPRAMPMIFPILSALSLSFLGGWVRGWWSKSTGSVRLRGRFAAGVGGRIARGDGDERRPQDLVAELVAAPDDVDDLALRPTRAGDVG